MERFQIMQQLKDIYEGILQGKDGRLYLQREAEVENLYLILQSSEDKKYSESEMDMLRVLSELNASMQSLLSTSMNRMQQAHEMSSKVSQQYEAPIFTDSYFYDRKY